MPGPVLRGRSASWWLREVGLTVAAVLGVVCLLSAVASIAFGVKPLVFRSGSMSPAIETGAVAIARTVPADTVRPGEIVSVTNAAGTRITHRVVEAGPGVGGTTTLILQGDANTQPDAEQYTVTEVDLVLLAVPGLGYLVAALSHPVAIFLGGGAVGALAMYAFGPRRRPPGGGDPDQHEDDAADEPDRAGPPPQRDRNLVPRRAATTGAVLLLAVGVAALPAVQPTAAAFTDTAAAATGAFGAYRVPAPTLTNCTAGLTSLTFSWSAVNVSSSAPAPSGVSYDLTLTPDVGAPSTTNHAGLTATRTSILGSGRASVQARATYGSTVWHSAPSNSIRYSLLSGVLSC